MKATSSNGGGGAALYPDLKGKVAVVTGGTTGIGLATARLFALQGVRVVIASRSEAKAKTALKNLSEVGDVRWVAADVTQNKSVARLIDAVLDTHGRLDYAFNNGASGGASVPVAKMTEAAWRKTIDAYLTSVFPLHEYRDQGNAEDTEQRHRQQRLGRWTSRLPISRRCGLLRSQAWGHRPDPQCST